MITVKECPFCQIIAGTQTAVDHRLHMTADAISFQPTRPIVPGHRLFVPRSHTEDAAADPFMAGAVAQQAAAWGATQREPFNIITSKGTEATQTVFHLHIHYVPRTATDGLTLPWTAQH